MYNVDLMLQVRDQITSEPASHNQDSYENTSCGTTRCIAGWAVFFAGLCKESVYEVDTFYEAQKLLGLTDEEAYNLFYNFSDQSAIEQLDRLIEKGKNQ